MTIAPRRPAPRQNHLLASLPPEDLGRLRPLLQPVRLRRKGVLWSPGEPISVVYFPLTAVCSSVSTMESGATIEVATVGRDGVADLALYFGAETVPFHVFTQIPGDALRMSGAAFREEVERSASFQGQLRRYAQALFVQTAQTAACNRLHTVEQRCARWLLMTHDRVAVDRFPLTQEFLAQILGVRRSSVTVAAGALQQGGAIRYAYGVVTVIDRPRLAAQACECYAIIAGEFERLLGFTGATAEMQ